MPKIKINGKDYEVQAGKTVLQACLENDIFVPYYCYHPCLSIVANCRMCLVKTSTSRKLEPSCAMNCADNMVIETESPDVQAARKSVLEFMLINHPIDCPICDKAGECDLQDFTYKWRGGLSRFDKEDKVIKHTKSLGPTIKIWGNRCIVCTRCVRFCDEVSGTGELCVVNRNDHSVVDVFPSVPLDNPLSLNTVDLCPVGALISKDFLYKARVWYTAQTDSVCPSCSRGCNIKVSVLNKEAKRFEPRFNAEVNQYWMCDEGRLNYKYINSELRLRTAKGSVRGLADSAKSIIAKYGANNFAGVISTYQTVEEMYLFKKVMEALGVKQIAFLTHKRGERQTFKAGFTIEADGTPNRRGAEIIFGKQFSESNTLSAVKGLFILNGIPNYVPPIWLNDVMQKAEFVAVCDIMQDKMTERAEIFLPGTAFVEKDGTFVNFQGRLQRISRCIDAAYPVAAEVEMGGGTLNTPGGVKGIELPGFASPETATLQKLLIELGVRKQVISSEGVFKELSKEIGAFKELTYAKIGESGVLLNGSR